MIIIINNDKNKKLSFNQPESMFNLNFENKKNSIYKQQEQNIE